MTTLKVTYNNLIDSIKLHSSSVPCTDVCESTLFIEYKTKQDRYICAICGAIYTRIINIAYTYTGIEAIDILYGKNNYIIL